LEVEVKEVQVAARRPVPAHKVHKPALDIEAVAHSFAAAQAVAQSGQAVVQNHAAGTAAVAVAAHSPVKDQSACTAVAALARDTLADAADHSPEGQKVVALAVDLEWLVAVAVVADLHLRRAVGVVAPFVAAESVAQQVLVAVQRDAAAKVCALVQVEVVVQRVFAAHHQRKYISAWRRLLPELLLPPFGEQPERDVPPVVRRLHAGPSVWQRELQMTPTVEQPVQELVLHAQPDASHALRHALLCREPLPLCVRQRPDAMLCVLT
jgi:hypothetical protein